MEEFDGAYLRVEGFSKPMLNMANFDFLGMGQRKELKEAAVQALDKVCYSTRCKKSRLSSANLTTDKKADAIELKLSDCRRLLGDVGEHKNTNLMMMNVSSGGIIVCTKS